MGDLLIRNVSDAVKANIRELAQTARMSLSDIARLALTAGIEPARRQIAAERDLPPPGEHLRQLFAGAFQTDEEAAEFRQILEEVRHGPERPLPFIE